MQEFTGIEYLKIDIANNFGLDKKDWNERIEWFDVNKDNLMDLVEKADTPALYYAGVKAFMDVQRSAPIGYPISLDGCASGLQILSCLTGDRRAAELCNVVNTGHRNDAYTIIYDWMADVIRTVLKMPPGTIKRDDAKQAVMTSLYGSKAVPKQVFGDGQVLKVFHSTMGELAPAAWELNQVFLDIWDNTVSIHSWVLPDNFHVHVKVMAQVSETVHFMNQPYETFRKVNMPIEAGRSLGANTTHSLDGFMVREITRRCDYDPAQIQEVKRIIFTKFDAPDEIDESVNINMVETLWDLYERSGYLSARILDHIDEESIHFVDRSVLLELVESLPVKPFKVMSIHDCFRVLPHYGNDLRRQYNRQLYLIAKSNMLSFLLSQILGRNVEIGKADPTLADDILDADYALS